MGRVVAGQDGDAKAKFNRARWKALPGFGRIIRTWQDLEGGEVRFGR